MNKHQVGRKSGPISRWNGSADLAACMLSLLADPATVHRHIAIAS
jgi:hypothetical protein